MRCQKVFCLRGAGDQIANIGRITGRRLKQRSTTDISNVCDGTVHINAKQGMIKHIGRYSDVRPDCAGANQQIIA